MIISRTPLRISFFGGGTDLKDFYALEGGAVLSTAIDKYIFVTVNKKFDDHIRVSYSKTEIVEHVDQVKHDLVREAMKLTGVNGGIEITTIADIPSQGTGLGSSSTFTVGVLNALYAYKGQHVSAEVLAQQACKIEIDIVGEPIGKQDQYITTYGGLQLIRFNPDGSVFVDPIICDSKFKRALQGNLMLFYTGITRRANSILTEQKKNSSGKKVEELKALKELALKAKKVIEVDKSLDEFGRLLDKNWEIKKSLAEGISKPRIDEFYQQAKKAGALGGKIAGAGGGGFLILYVPKDRQPTVRQALSSLRELTFCFEAQGSKIIYVCD
ncbi:GHMP kinase [Candidatus Margulisiibacteriota bacterium]